MMDVCLKHNRRVSSRWKSAEIMSLCRDISSEWHLISKESDDNLSKCQNDARSLDTRAQDRVWDTETNEIQTEN